jgi:hypothetical protein
LLTKNFTSFRSRTLRATTRCIGSPGIMADRGVEVEDRGEAGIFADYQSAAWYAHALDPVIEPWHVIESFY